MSSDRPRTYNVIHPPRLPERTKKGGNWLITNWSQDSWRYTARENSNGTRFDVRQLAIENFLQKEHNSFGAWPGKYRLGPPSSTPDWHPLVEKYGLQVLERAGFINYRDTGGTTLMTPVGRLAEKRKGEEPMHPVLRKDMWPGLSDDDYELLVPALTLATAFLDEPTTMNFFHAITQPAGKMRRFTDTVLGVCDSVTIKNTLSEKEQAEVYNKIVKMRYYTSFNIKNVARMMQIDGLGETVVRRDAQGNRVSAGTAHTYRTTIDLSQTFLDTLRTFDDDVFSGKKTHKAFVSQTMRMACMPEDRKLLEYDLPSNISRTNLLLADTVLHEFAHAFCSAYYPCPNPNVPQEPWIDGNRSNELGKAFSHYIMNGPPEPTIFYFPPMSVQDEHKQYVCPPFGLHFFKAWDQWAVMHKGNAERVVAAGQTQAFNTSNVIYPIPQEHIFNMETEETWAHQVPRFGLEALGFPKIQDWSVQWQLAERIKGYYNTGEDRCGDGENAPRPAGWM